VEHINSLLPTLLKGTIKWLGTMPPLFYIYYYRLLLIYIMGNTAVKIAVMESEAGWGKKIEDWMVCLTNKDAKLFEEEFNSKNTAQSVPDWYMQVEGEPVSIDLTDKQFAKLKKENRVWLSTLKRL
jgi:hypothetical protein